jgi:hypothetical protein
MAFGKKKEGLYLRPRVRRTTPLMDIAFAVVLGGVSGVYIFQDTLMRWQISEGLDPLAVNAGPSSADVAAAAAASSTSASKDTSAASRD